MLPEASKSSAGSSLASQTIEKAVDGAIKAFQVHSSRVGRGCYDLVIEGPALPEDVRDAAGKLLGVQHVMQATPAGRLITLTVDSDRHWKQVRDRVEKAVLASLDPDTPHSPEDLRDALRRMRASVRTPSDSQQVKDFLLRALELVLASAINPVLKRDKGSCSFATLTPVSDDQNAPQKGGRPSTPRYDLTLHMNGACKGCPVSSITMKAFIEKTVTEFLPEIASVSEQEEDD